MARLALAPLFLLLLPAPVWAQSAPNFGTSLQRALEPDRPEAFRRDFTIGQPSWLEPENRISITARIGPNLTAGIGMYGHKRDKAQPSVTARDLSGPKSRRAGVGLSLKF